MPLSKTVFELLNEVGVTAGIPHQDIIYGTPTTAQPDSEYSRVLRSVAYDAVQHLLRYHAWEDLWRLAEFSVGANDQTIPLPPDCDRMTTETFFEQNQGWWRPSGPTRPGAWQFFKNYAYSPVQPVWRWGAGELILLQTPDTDRVFEFEYITQWPIVAAGGKTKREITFDSDATLFDNYILKLELKWRLLKERGESWREDKYEAEREKKVRAGQEQGGANPVVIGGGDINTNADSAFTTDGASTSVLLR